MERAIPIQRHLIFWLTLSRFGAAARGILPFLLGATIAWSQGNPINWTVLVISAVAALLIMLMAFLINEYNDYETDIKNKEFHRLSGGSRVLAMGLIPRYQSLLASGVCFLIASSIGFWLYFYCGTGPYTLPLGALAIVIGYFYTAKPLRLSYKGWGEVAIWFSCGWLVTISGYYLQAGHFDTIATLASLPGATSIFLVILINEIPDINSDRLSGKNNLAVRLGREKTAILYIVLLTLCYLNIIAISFLGIPEISRLLSLILIPLIIWNILTIKRRGVNNTKTLEGLSLRTMLIDHVITIIYAAAFIIAGFSLMAGQLVAIAMAYIIAFSLEGLGIICSNLTLRHSAP